MDIHIDMSNRYFQGNYSVIGAVGLNPGQKNIVPFRKAIIIADPLRNDLCNTYGEVKLHAALCFMLISEQKSVNSVILCNDVHPLTEVINCMERLDYRLRNKILSLFSFRVQYSLSVSSAADGFCLNVLKNYPKRKNMYRRKQYFDDESIIVIDSKDKRVYDNLIYYLEQIKIG